MKHATVRRRRNDQHRGRLDLGARLPGLQNTVIGFPTNPSGRARDCAAHSPSRKVTER